MGFFDFIKSTIGKISDFVAPVISKIGDGIGSAIDFGRKAVNFASNLPVIGDVVRTLQSTPVGMAIGTIANAIRPEQGGGSSSAVGGQPVNTSGSSFGPVSSVRSRNRTMPYDYNVD